MAKLMNPTGHFAVTVNNPTIGEYGVLLRTPTPKELNEYQSNVIQVRGGNVIDRRVEAQSDLFDLLLTEVTDLQNFDGDAVTPAQSHLIPVGDKVMTISRLFGGSDVTVLEKN